MKIKLLRQVQKRILNHADQFDMEIFHHDCGTPACIAGFLIGAVPEEMAKNSIYNADSVAGRLLGLDYNENDDHCCAIYRLFRLDEWPEKYYLQYSNAKYAKGRARAAVRRIGHFIKTKGKE